MSAIEPQKFQASYGGARPDLLRFVVRPRFVLDVGCYEGSVARALKHIYPACHVTGLEVNSIALLKGRISLDRSICCDLDNLVEVRRQLGESIFDTVICGDVLEHTESPWRLMELFYSHLAPGGEIYVSLPNVSHWELILHLMRLRWPYRDRGVFDATHKRWFMRGNLRSLCPTGGEFKLLDRNYRIREKGDGVVRLLTHIVSKVPWFREYFVFQYYFSVRKPVL